MVLSKKNSSASIGPAPTLCSATPPHTPTPTRKEFFNSSGNTGNTSVASSTDSAFIEDLEIEEDFPVLFPDKTSSKKPETFVVKNQTENIIKMSTNKAKVQIKY